MVKTHLLPTGRLSSVARFTAGGLLAGSALFTAGCPAVPTASGAGCDTDFSVDVTLENTDEAVDYTFNCVVPVSGKLTIEPGTVIAFGPEGGLEVSGRLVAKGTADAPIVFQGTEARAGAWKGVMIDSDDPENALHHVTVAHAGGSAFNSNDDLGSVLMWADGVLDMNTVHIKDGGAYGINLSYDAVTLGMQGVTIENTANAALRVSPHSAAQISPDTVFDADAEVELWGHAIDGVDMVLPRIDAVWRVIDRTQIDVANGSLTLPAGTEIAFGEGSGLWIEDTANILIEGTMEAPVLLRGVDETKGAWSGLGISSSEGRNLLQHTVIRHAGGEAFNSNGDRGALILWSDTEVDLNTLHIESSASYGINASYDGVDIGMNLVTITDTDNAPVRIGTSGASSLSWDTTFDPGTYVELWREDLVDDHDTWQPLAVPYRFEDDLQLTLNNSTLTLLDGVEVEFGENAGIWVGTGSDLVIDGRSDSIVHLRGTDPTPGSWAGIGVESEETSVFDHVLIENAGGAAFNSNGDLGAIVVWADAALAVRNSEIRTPGSECGINATYAGETLSLSNVTYTGVTTEVCQEN